MKYCISLLALFSLILNVSLAQDRNLGKISALVFYEYSYNADQTITNAFEVQRAYFTYQHQLAEQITYKFQIDVGRTSSDGRLSAYLKNAKIDWATSLGKITLGLQGMNIFNVQEQTWGYRFIEKTALERNGFASSADLGIGFYHTLANTIHLSTLITNGQGYKLGENDNYKKFSFQTLYGAKNLLNQDGLNLGGIFSLEPFATTPGSTANKIVFGGFTGYARGPLRVGLEYNLRSNSASELTATIFSIYGHYQLSQPLEAFARFDSFDPDQGTTNDASSYVIVGTIWRPVTGLFLAPNLKIITPQTGATSTTYSINFQFKL